MQIKILVVDDSASDRLIITSMLSEYPLLTACDGLKAVRMLEEHEGINLIILDLNMPNMNGFQVLKALKEDERFRNIRTIILSNYDELDNEIEGLRYGAVDYIRKPIHMESLKARIDVHISLLHANHAIEKQLGEQTLTFDMIFDQAPIGIAISHCADPKCTDDIVERINPMYEQITGRTKKELVASGWAKITHPDDVEEDLENFKKLQAGIIKSYSMEKRIIKPDGSISWVNMVVAALSQIGKNRLNHICLFQDISERKQIEIERRYISEHDRLTGLFNRTYLERMFEEHSKNKKSLKRALIGINLSNISVLTARYGYLYTQGLLKKAAEVLSQYCTEHCILFHSHENRFVFYLTQYKDKSELVHFSDTVADTLESLFATDRIGGGIGVLEIGPDQNDVEVDLQLRRLLIASERSISLFGKYFEACFYDKELETLVNRERDITEALTAVAAEDYDNDELYLQFQPILDLRTGSICSFEALARLSTYQLGLVSPAEFIPIAEKSKLIIPIGEKVIVKALRFMNRLKELGYEALNVSINISPIQLLSANFTERLFERIGEMQVNLGNIGIEITESVFASDYDKINNIIEKLREAGMHIAIDDFGIGYSSLARENELKVDSLKIDKSFIDKLISVDPHKAIIGDIISMAHKLGHYVVAEGVEQEVQLAYLKKYGCDKIQGYLISKPLHEEMALAFLKEHENTYQGLNVSQDWGPVE